MGDLAIDAAVAGGDGSYTAKLSPEWAAWGPVGGYLAAILARAAQAHSDHTRVASLTCHFLSVGRFDAVELEVATLRRARRAESVRVVMRQDDKPIAEGLVWLVADDLAGLAHDAARMPAVPGPEALRSWTELQPDAEEPPMWNNIDSRPPRWPERPGTEAYTDGWYRFLAHTDDDLGRELVLLDVLGSGAVWMRHGPELEYVTPNLDLSVQFHRPAPPGTEWLYAEAFADVAEGGLVGFRSKVWSRDGLLLASGSGQLLCRRPG